MNDRVAPDGSPVDVYRALPAGETPAIIDSALRPASSILELGSGPGRITHPLSAMGHEVVAVDDSAAMLSHVRRAERVHADLFTLDLGRVFDAVVAGSHLINATERDRRLDLLGVCRQHVADEGVVLIERYRPDWAADPQPSSGELGAVSLTFEPLGCDGETFSGRVTYVLGDSSWAQEFTAVVLTDEMLAQEARVVGLRLGGWLDDAATWASLSPED